MDALTQPGLHLKSSFHLTAPTSEDEIKGTITMKQALEVNKQEDRLQFPLYKLRQSYFFLIRNILEKMHLS